MWDLINHHIKERNIIKLKSFQELYPTCAFTWNLCLYTADWAPTCHRPDLHYLPGTQSKVEIDFNYLFDTRVSSSSSTPCLSIPPISPASLVCVCKVLLNVPWQSKRWHRLLFPEGHANVPHNTHTRNYTQNTHTRAHAQPSTFIGKFQFCIFLV